MGASFAKAVMPRVRREGEPGSEHDWVLGWIYPENTNEPPVAEFESPGVTLRKRDETTPKPASAEDNSH